MTANVDSEPEKPTGPLTAAHESLIATASSLDDSELQKPSRVSAWTREHVLTHVIRHCEHVTNSLNVVARGKPPTDPDDGDDASVIDQLRAHAARLAKAIMNMPDDGWGQEVTYHSAGMLQAGSAESSSAFTLPARRLLWLHWRELELRHVDLDAGYLPHHWPAHFVTRAVREYLAALRHHDAPPSVTISVAGLGSESYGRGDRVAVAGSPHDFLGWVTGRLAKPELEVSPPGALPHMPTFS